jgi:hypothetical protein
MLVLAAIALAGCGGAAAAPRLPSGAIRVDVSRASSGPRIPAGFVGVSTEYTSLLAYAGRDPHALNPLFIRLVKDLAPGGSPVVRIGGDTTDWTWWPLPGARKPPWARYVLSRQWISVARAFAVATRARLILGINFEADSRALAGAESRALMRGIGDRALAAFELGNEPEVYGELGWYRTSAGAGVLGRTPSYGFRSYLGDFHAVSEALPPDVPIAGPSLALTWPLTIAGRFLRANPRVRLFTFHFYPLKRCFNARTSPTYPTLANLLSRRSAVPPRGTAAAVSSAHDRGVAVRVDEFNSVSCRGRPGLSDSFASALWALDALFALARSGVDGVNLHTLPEVSYQLFTFTHSHGEWEASVKPIYYGLLLFTQAAPAGSRLVRTTQPGERALRTWATRDPGGTVRVVLINDSGSHGLTVAVRPPEASSRRAELERLTAPGLLARSCVTLGGRSFGALTSTATLAGVRRISLLKPVDQRYVIKLAPASAALLTVRPR